MYVSKGVVAGDGAAAESREILEYLGKRDDSGAELQEMGKAGGKGEHQSQRNVRENLLHIHA